MEKKNITIDDLAIMINNGFEKTATKQQFFDLENKFEKRFDKIEKLILADHRERIERLEEQVKELKSLLAM